MKIINKIISLSILLSFGGCVTQTTSNDPFDTQPIVVNIQPYLGQSFPEWKKEYGYLVNPDNNFIKRIMVSYKGIEYELGVSDNQVIQYIATSDKHFSINGYKVGDVINKNHTRLGWGSYTKIDQEWYAAWFPESRNEKKGRIQWFFKFKFEIDGTVLNDHVNHWFEDNNKNKQ